MPEPVARRRLREEREKATAERLAADTTTCEPDFDEDFLRRAIEREPYPTAEAYARACHERDTARAELEKLRARIAGLDVEWGVAVEGSHGAVVADDESAARRTVARNGHYYVPGGDGYPVRYHVARREATPWRDADANE